MNGNIGGRARCDAEVVGESVAGVDRRGLCWVSVSRRGTGAVALATDCAPSQKWSEEEGE
jgi:hypothetical protein